MGPHLHLPPLTPWPGLSAPSAAGTHWGMSRVPLLARRVVVAIQETAKGCAGSVYSPVWVGSGTEKLGRELLAWEVLREAYV